jgi:hypothetical protein
MGVSPTTPMAQHKKIFAPLFLKSGRLLKTKRARRSEPACQFMPEKISRC